MTLLSSRKLSLLILVAMLGMFVSAKAQEDRISISVGGDIATKYVWRGQQLNADAVFQPTVDLSVKVLGGTLGFNWWGVQDLTDLNGQKDSLTETDHTISFTKEFGPVELSAGYIYYYFPQITGESDTTEIYIGAGMTLFEKGDFSVSGSATIYYDCENIGGFYGNIGIEAGMPLNEKWSLSVSAGIGVGDDNHNNAYFGLKNDGITDVTASVGLTCKIDDKSELSLSATWSDVIDGDLEQAAEAGYGDDNVWYFMVGLSHSF